MKKVKWTLGIVVAMGAVATMMIVESCSKSDAPPPALTLVSLTAGTIDLNGAASAVKVPVNSPIVATFSTTLDSTGIKSNISLIQDYDQTTATFTAVVSGNTLTITPKALLSAGNLYDLNLSAAIKSTAGKTLTTAVPRTFTTAGFFTPANEVAHWGFENNANDDAGSGTNYNASSSGIVGITYVAGRNTDAGMAASFDGKTSIIEIPNAPSLINTTDFTVTFWIKTTYSIQTAGDTLGNFVMGLGGYYGFECEFAGNLKNGKMAAQYAYTGGSESQDLWMDATGNLGWQGWTYSKNLQGSGGLQAVINNQWAQMVYSYASATKIGSIYLNGVLQKTQNFNDWPSGDNLLTCSGLTLNTTGVSSSSNLAIGYYCDRATANGTTFSWANYSDQTAGHFLGLLDDVRIFHKALSQSEITALYNSENQ